MLFFRCLFFNLIFLLITARGFAQPNINWPTSDQALAQAKQKPIVVLVPGFFNSLAYGYSRAHSGHVNVEPYFSLAIIEAIENQGYASAVVDNLLPTGSVVENGLKLSGFINQLHAQNPDHKLIVIAHSAGGFYLLSAFENISPSWIEAVVTISTPYQGVGIVDSLNQTLPAFNSLVRYISLDSLLELRAKDAIKFMQQHSLPKNVRWVALGGYQHSCYILDCNQAQNLSWLMSLAQTFIGQPSDGIVSYSSSLALDLNLPMERWSHFSLPLEHWEIVQDYRLFSLLGVTNSNWIRAQQTQIFNEIMKRLELKSPRN